MKRSLIQVGIALAVLGTALGAYLFGYNQVEQAVNESAAIKQEIAGLIDQSAHAAETSSVLESIVADEEAVNERFLSLADVPIFLEELEDTGATLGSSVEVMSVSDKASAEGRIDIALRVTGPFDAIMRTIGSIEYSARDIRIESLTLDASTVEGEEGWTAAAVFSSGIEGAAATVKP